ncbi:MAG TPA: polyphosphate kinase 1 [Casimicrobiaceae bacterium]|nr:polyphosphate kinase 1 [Casimicrobiaceae bacterium]
MHADRLPCPPSVPGIEPGPQTAVLPHPAHINRELSTLAFNRRVLALASDARVPLLERLRFLCIVGSNLDEFFEIRVAGLKEQLRENAPGFGMPVQDARALLGQIGTGVRALIADQYRVLNDEVLPALERSGVRLIRRSAWTPAQRAWVADYFAREVRPLLTPIGLDPAHPFPQVVNKSLNFVVELSGSDAFGRETSIAILRAPRVLPRVIRMPGHGDNGRHDFLLLSSIIHTHIAALFPGREVIADSQFRVTRDADVWIDEEEVKNLRQALQGELSHRHFGRAVRLELPEGCPLQLADFLLRHFELAPDDLYHCNGPVNIMRLEALIDQVDIGALKYAPFRPGLPARLPTTVDVLVAMRQRDILLHHPYQSFEPVVEFIRKAAQDPDVLAIKQTVYRTGVNSALMESLVEAARQGKEVTVVVELMARFDEETNIDWAERLEQAGAQVVYGIFGLKTHAKLVLITRREADARGRPRLVPYAHLGTGNYHPRTTRLYTDFGLLTADPAICADVAEVFLHITSLAKANRLRQMLLAPFTMQSRVIAMIRREARHARAGRPSGIRAKMNALVDDGVIQALYAASRAGVPIELVIRGACALRPGVPGLSQTIRVRSILGRFLEHHRVWRFENDGAPSVWLSSADWMGRNLFKRIEVAFPVRDPELAQRAVAEGLDIYLRDTEGAWELGADGTWSKVQAALGTAPFSAQADLMMRLGGGNEGGAPALELPAYLRRVR